MRGEETVLAPLRAALAGEGVNGSGCLHVCPAAPLGFAAGLLPVVGLNEDDAP
jgi:hypothetical protein